MEAAQRKQRQNRSWTTWQISKVRHIRTVGCIFLLCLLLMDAGNSQAAEVRGVLENPQTESVQSGINIVSGWVCDAHKVEVVIDGKVYQAGYGTIREDTRPVCGDDNNGFGFTFNWNHLLCGTHTLQALADGVEFGRATFTVTRPGAEVLRGVTGRCSNITGLGFPSGQNLSLVWQESQQNFVMQRQEPSGGGNSRREGIKAFLDNPSPGSSQSGIGLIYGWACDAQQIDIVIDGTAYKAAYGTIREDTKDACHDDNNGFGLLFNWNRIGDGQHTVSVRADGEEFARTDVTVTTLGEEFKRSIEGECVIENFPQVGLSTTLRWEESLQNFVMADITQELELKLEGQVFDNPQDRRPVAGAMVSIDEKQLQTDADGRFSDSFFAPWCPEKTVRLRLLDSSQNIYRLTTANAGNLQAASAIETQTAALEMPTSVEFFATPVAAASAQITVTPTLAAPGGPATITAPQDNAVIKCAPPPSDCRFPVQGIASPSLGQPGTPYHLFVAVKPLGGKVVPQFPPVSVDPQTGTWLTEAQLGGGRFPAQEGQDYEILAFVTSVSLQQGIPDALTFDSAVDIPGVTHISRFVRLTVGSREENGGPAALSVPPVSLDFGCVRESNSKMLTITNKGGEILTGRISSSSSAFTFSLIGGENFTLQARERKLVTVRFGPAGEGTFNGTLTVESTAGSATVPLSGRGATQCADPPLADKTARITEPLAGDLITCAPPPAECRFRVRGVADKALGQPGTPLRLYLAVRPLGGGTVPQFPPLTVDPFTGAWETEAQIGGGVYPAREDDIFELLTFVTDTALQPSSGEALFFSRPIEAPGVQSISQFVPLIVGPRGNLVLNEQLMAEAWQAYNARDYETAMMKAEQLVQAFKDQADSEQAALQQQGTPLPPLGKVSEQDKAVIFARGLLNDVGTAFYVIGISAEALGRTAQAREAYQQAMNYPYARTWDLHGFFWSPAQAASEKLSHL